MRKMTVSWLALILVLGAACGGIRAQVPDTDPARAAQVLVEKWIAAYGGYDVDGMLLLYSEDITWMDNGYDDGPYHQTVLTGALHEWFDSRALKVEVRSYTITRSGRFAVIDAVYSELNGLTKKWRSTPATCILEFRDGLILAETWYYDTTAFLQP